MAEKASSKAPKVQTPPSVTMLTGKGVDIGTANIAVSVFQSKQVNDGEGSRFETSANTTFSRDSFLTFPINEEAVLASAGVPYEVSSDEQHLLVLGVHAAPFAQAMGIPLRRPLAKGFISDKEDLSKEVVKLILAQVLGEPTSPGEIAVFSIPGMPIDGDTPKANYHTRFFSDRLREMGYTPVPLNEAMAVCFNELVDVGEGKTYTGLNFSFGAGMVNCALVFKGVLIRAFSLSMGGDFIDEAVAKATNTPLSHVTALKEDGVYLVDMDVLEGDETIRVTQGTIKDRREGYHDSQSDRQAEAISMMYRELLTKLREVLANFLVDPANRVDIKDTIPVIVSGGTAMAPGFVSLFNEIVLNGLVTRLSLGKSAMLARSPMGAVALGALNYAQMRQSKGASGGN